MSPSDVRQTALDSPATARIEAQAGLLTLARLRDHALDGTARPRRRTIPAA